MNYIKWMSVPLALCLATSCATANENNEDEIPPPVDIEVKQQPDKKKDNIDTGWFGITKPVPAEGALLRLPQSFETQLLDTTSAVKVNDRWMPEVQVLMARDEEVDVSVAVSVRPITPDSGDALVSNALQREAERTTDGNQTWLHIRRETAPWWRTVVFIPIEDTMWVVDFLGKNIEQQIFDDFVVGTMEEATFAKYPDEDMLQQAIERAEGENIDDRKLPEKDELPELDT